MSLSHEASIELFRGRHFNHEIITLWVRWYVTYKLTYRDLVEMMAERHVASAYYNYTLGAAVHPRIRKTLAALYPTSRHLVAVR